MDLGLAESTVLITGGTSGLGFATAQAVVAEGARVLLVGRDPERAAAAQRKLGPAADAVVGDLAAPATASRIVAAAAQAAVPVTAALLSVGGPPPTTVLGATDQQWEHAFASLVTGPLRVVRELLAAQTPLQSLAWVLSTSARSPVAGLSLSNAIRPGLAMLVKDLADEIGPRGVRVNALLPGRIDTPRLAALETAGGDAANTRRRISETIPLRRYGDPAEFGAAAAFLLSDRASYVTGSLLAVDGGLTRAV